MPTFRAYKQILMVFMFFVMSLPSCGMVQNLRKEVEDEEPRSETIRSDFDYKDPAHRNVPPAPVNARDDRAAAVSGTPVDLAGVRAKNLRVTSNDFANENAKNENSLWAEDGQNNYFFARNKLKMPGDLISVVIEDSLRADMVNEVKKLMPPEYRDMQIRVPGLTKDGAAAGADAKAGAAKAEAAAVETGSSDILTAEVLERYPNGNLRLRGIKRVPFKRQVRNIEVLAIVKGSDIDENDHIKSSRFFEHHVELYR